MTRTSLPRSRPAVQGVQAAGIGDFLDAVEHRDIQLHSVMVLRHGHVVAEAWWAPYSAGRVHLGYSLSKSFTSTAAGLAVADGLLDLEAPVVSYFPEHADAATDPRTRSMTVAHLAAMSTGHREDTLHRVIRPGVDPVRGFLALPPEAEPGSVFTYDNGGSYVLAAVVQRVTGSTLLDHLRSRVLDPLGIDDAVWLQDDLGRDLGFSGLHLRTESIAAFGQLLLDRGSWHGVSLLPAGWVDLATALHTPNPAQPDPDWQQGYGYQFWRSRHGYRGDGAFGQFCLVLPEQDSVVVTTAATDDMQGVLDEVWAHLLPALGPQGGGTAAADRALVERTGGLALPGVPGRTEPADPAASTRVAFRPAAGAATEVPGLRSVELERVPGGHGWRGRLVEAGASLPFELGVGSWTVAADDEPLAVLGGWTDDALVLDVVLVETAHRLRLTCSPNEGTFAAAWHTRPLHTLLLRELRAPAPTLGA